MKTWINRAVCAVCLALIVFNTVSCGEKEVTPAEGSMLVFYRDTADTRLVSKGVELESEGLENNVRELLDDLGSSDDKTLKPALPADVRVNDIFFGEDGRLIIDFDQSYLAQTGIPEILSRAAVVRTLCQLDGVSFVEFYVDGQSLILSGDQPVGIMSASDFIDNTGGYAEFTQTSYVTVYFANESGDALNDISIEIESDGSKSNEQLVAEQLIAGPDAIVGAKDVFPSIPEGTTLNKITTRDGICYIDLGSEFLNKRENVTTDVAIYSIVNSLCELPTVSKVVITIEGEADRSVEGKSLSGIFERNLELISE
ncbi:MAG: GerMN domain-containing protein [Lachnospiraceae bacterium]|nr:GerMN domain-containing protein [Lachnospiraceae bacterium]